MCCFDVCSKPLAMDAIKRTVIHHVVSSEPSQLPKEMSMLVMPTFRVQRKIVGLLQVRNRPHSIQFFLKHMLLFVDEVVVAIQNDGLSKATVEAAAAIEHVHIVSEGKKERELLLILCCRIRNVFISIMLNVSLGFCHLHEIWPTQTIGKKDLCTTC